MPVLWRAGLGLLLRYLGWLGPAMSFGQSDFTILFWPFHDFSIREWLAGRVPLWNNSIYGGQPHLASIEAGVFYPLSLVELLLAGHGGPLTGIFTRIWLDTCIEVSAPASGLLVVSEPYYPGWQADIDGRAVAIERADYALEAVPVPAGDHLVRLTYKPASFRLGAALSLASIAAFAVIVLASLLRSRRGQH